MRPSLFTLMLAAISVTPLFAAESAADLEFVTADIEMIGSEFQLDGRIEAVNRATVSAQTSGRIVELPYDVDDYVPAGAVIVRFRDTEQQARVNQAEAALEEAIARNTQAQKELERIAGLREEGVVSQSDYDRVEAEAEAAAARLESARAALETAREQLEYTRVRAPYAGIVTARHVEMGELAQPGQPLMSGLSLEQLRVVVDVPQSMIAPVREQSTAIVITPQGERLAADISSIFPFADEATHSFRLRADLPQVEGAKLFPGMLVKTVFVTGEREALLLPRDSIARRGEVTAAYVEGPGGALQFRQLRIGRDLDGRVEILAGLAANEKVALDPVAAAAAMKQQATREGGDE